MASDAVFRYGNNETLPASSRCAVPCGLAGQNAKVFVHEVPGNAPLLVSLELLEAMGAVLDTRRKTVFFERTGRTVQLKRSRAGHLLIPMKEFAEGGYSETDTPTVEHDEVVVYLSSEVSSSSSEGSDDVDLDAMVNETIQDLHLAQGAAPYAHLLV